MKNIENFLAQSRVSQTQGDLIIEEGAQDYLKTRLGIDLKHFRSKIYYM